ncbi:MAG: hypothetical protein ACYTEV_01375 [Planctomycetota bacterium]|jgi:hypothetical protein
MLPTRRPATRLGSHHGLRRTGCPPAPAAATRLRLAASLAVALAAACGGCAPRGYDPALAAPAYPADAHTAESVDIQLFRDGPDARLVNATVTSHRDVRLWINQRWVRDIPDLPAGGIVDISLDGFRDLNGEQFVAGGFFRTERMTPIVLAQIQQRDDPGAPLLGIRVVGPIFESQ